MKSGNVLSSFISNGGAKSFVCASFSGPECLKYLKFKRWHDRGDCSYGCGVRSSFCISSTYLGPSLPFKPFTESF